MVLRKTQRNELFELVKENGLEPSAFRLTTELDVLLVTHKSSESTFQIEASDEYFYAESTIEDSSQNNYDNRLLDWDELVGAFREWAREVKLETDTPDLWAEVLQGNEFLSDAPQQDLANTPFTVQEQAQIAAHLQEIKAYVKEACALSVEQTARMEAAFDEAEKASSRIGRKDWLLLFGGTLLSLVTTTILPPHVVEQILVMTAQAIGYMFGLPPQIS